MGYNTKKDSYQKKINRINEQTQKESGKLLAGLILSLILMFLFPLLGILCLFVFVYPSMKKITDSGKRTKQEVGQEIIRDIMDQLFDQAEYLPDHRLPDALIHSVSIPGLDRFDRIYGNDYISGVFHGLNFEMSDITLTQIHEVTDSDGRERTEEKEKFNGLWFVCDFAKQIDSSISISPRPSFSLRKGISLESEEFNRRMLVESDSEHDVYYVLTPSLMEQILNTMKQMKCHLYFFFSQDGHVHILLDRGNALEISAPVRDVDQLHQQFTRQLRQVTEIIDQLRLSEAYR